MNYFFIGIGGISMSALAVFLKKQGNFVAGSDISLSMKDYFMKEDILFFNSKSTKRFCCIDAADVVVINSAIKDDNPELVYAKEKDKKILTRGEILGQIAAEYKYVIAIAGSHGKSTTTGLVYSILSAAGLLPSLHLGGFLVREKTNYVAGSGDCFVTEACEYHDNFLYLNPYISVVLNIEAEHLDYFKTFENELKSFDRFKKQSKFIVTPNENIKIKNISHGTNGGIIFDLYDGKKVLKIITNLCEEVNAKNIVCAYRVAKILKISDDDILLGIKNFLGVKSRFERVLSQNFDDVVIDYAHHPTEILNTILTTKNIYAGRKIVYIFQPHTYSRTKNLLKEFLDVFKNEEVLLFKTYSAREKKLEGVSAFELSKMLKKSNKNISYFGDAKQLKNHIEMTYQKDTVLVFIGAGDLPAKLKKLHFYDD